MNGGYFMIDFTGLNLSESEAQEIEGIYKIVYAALDRKKPICCYNLSADDGVIVTPTFGSAVINGTTITLTVYGKTLTITNDDNVVVAA